MNYDVEKFVLDTIEARGISKKSVYTALDKTQSGFEYMMKNKSTTVKDLIKIADVMNLHPCDFFGNVEKTNTVKDTKAKYLVQQNGNGSNHASIDENKSLKDEVEFLRKQVQSLTEMLNKALNR